VRQGHQAPATRPSAATATPPSKGMNIDRSTGVRNNMGLNAGSYAAGTASLTLAYAAWFGGPPAALAVAALGAIGLAWLRRRPPAAEQAPGHLPTAPAPAPATGLEALIDLLHLAAFQTDAQGQLRVLGQAWEGLSGRPVSDALGRPVWTFLHPDDVPAAQTAFQALLRGDTPQLAQEWRLIDAAGKTVWVSLRARALTLQGQATGAAGSIEEITRRKHLDERLQSTRGYVNALLANVPGLVYRSRNDRSYTMEFISDGCLDLTGYEPYELIENRRLAYGDLVHPEDREFLWTHIQAHLARQAVYQVAYRITDASGRLRWVWEQGRGVFASQGELLAIEGFITDMSERRGAEEQAKRRLWFEARTGLTPRAIFDSLLAWSQQQAQAGGTPCALLVIDLLGLDERAAQQGHEWAERALTVLARRLGPVLGAGAQATHLGHHRFAALVHDLRGQGHEPGAWDARHLILPASRLAAAVAERMRGPLPGEAGPGPDCAIGIAITAPRYGSGEAVLQAAQRAAVQAARLEGERIEFADE